jgi:hypothetical protein
MGMVGCGSSVVGLGSMGGSGRREERGGAREVVVAARGREARVCTRFAIEEAG